MTLTCEEVLWRGKSGKSFAIKEFFEKWPEQPRLLVVSVNPLPVEAYWCVDVTGVLQTLTGTLPSGAVIQQRVLVVSPENVSIYCDRQGRAFPVFPIKGCDDSWYTKRPLASSSALTASLPSVPDTPDPPLPTAGSRDSIRSLPEGAVVSINGAVVTGAFKGRFCTERSNRSFAIWVRYPGTLPKGSLVDITGRMTTEGTSRTLVADLVTTLDADFPDVDLVEMNNRDTNYGLDTTGMYIRTWGKVKQVISLDRVFYIDDGLQVNSESGIKVYDTTEDALPSVDNFVVEDGYSGSEDPGIRTLWKTTSGGNIYSLSTVATGTGTVSGTITASGVNGASVQVYFGKASTKATFVDGTAHYTLKVPYGSHAVTASVAGYKTTTKLVRVSAQTPNPKMDATLPALAKKIDIIAVPTDTLADGTKEFSVTMIFRDEEGRRISNATTAWVLSTGLVVSSDSMTDVVGEAKALVRRAPSASATIEARVGEVSSAKSLD